MGGTLQRCGFLALFLLLFVEPARSQQKCEDVFAETQLSETQMGIVTTLSDLLESWSELLSERVHFPDVNIVFEQKSINESFYSSATNEIHIGILGEGKPLDLENVLGPIFAHEFGHALFKENFSLIWRGKTVNFAGLANIYASEVDRVNSTPEILSVFRDLKKIERLISLAVKTKSSEDEKRLRELYSQKKEEYVRLVPALVLFEKLTELSIIHNELWADSFAALWWKNPKIITNALDHSHLDELSIIGYRLAYRGRNKDAASDPRDFQITSFKNWHKEIADKYTMFDPVRGALWELYMKNLPREEIHLFMKVFFAATGRQVSDLLEASYQGSSLELEPSKFNRDFLRLFVEEARRLGLKIRK